MTHRDVKPQNILRSAEGRWVLCDFGNAKHVDSCALEHTWAGTPMYISPQLRQGFGGERACYSPFKSDVYSLGLSLYYAATLRPPLELVAQDNLETNTQTAIKALPYPDTLKYVMNLMLKPSELNRPDFLQLQSYLNPTNPSKALSLSQEAQKVCTGCSSALRSNYYALACGHPVCAACKDKRCFRCNPRLAG